MSVVAILLQEQIEVAVAVDVHELRPRHVEAAEEGQRERLGRVRSAQETARQRASNDARC